MHPPQGENRQWTLQVGSCLSVLLLIRQASLKDGHKGGPKVFFCTPFNPFAPGDFAEKRVLKLVEWFSGLCRAIKS